MRRTFALAVTLSLAAVAAPARAGDAAAAEVLFQQGRAASDKGDVATACVKFRESNRLDPAVGTVFNIGDCEEKLGHLATAWQLFREVVQRLPPADERVTIAKQRATALDKRVPRLTVHLADGSPAGAKVSRDGSELGAASLDVALPVDPGEHTIEVDAPGRARSSTKVSLAEAETKTIEARAGAPSSAGPSSSGTTTAPPADDGSGRRTAGYVVGGIGAAGIVVGAITGFMVLGKKSTVDDNCNAAKRCSQTGLDAADSGKTLGTVSGIGFIAGAVGLGVGTWLVLSSDGKKETAIGPSVLPGGGGVSVKGSWLRSRRRSQSGGFQRSSTSGRSVSRRYVCWG